MNIPRIKLTVGKELGAKLDFAFRIACIATIVYEVSMFMYYTGAGMETRIVSLELVYLFVIVMAWWFYFWGAIALTGMSMFNWLFIKQMVGETQELWLRVDAAFCIVVILVMLVLNFNGRADYGITKRERSPESEEIE
jgi:hypothetical protein